MSLVHAALIAAVSSVAAGSAPAPQPQERPSQITAVSVATTTESQRPSPVIAPAPSKGATKPAVKSHRWFDIQTGQVDARYRVIDSSAGVRTSNLVQHRQTMKAAFKIDPQGRYAVQAGLGTGNTFGGSWEATGLGTGDPTWGFAVRTLYVSAQPIKGLELQVGGLAATVRGESSEITAYDNDGYLVGERVSVKHPTRLYLDEVSATIGYLGDVSTPNVFARVDHMDDHNYTQILAAKRLGPRVAASVDWTKVAGLETWRQGVRLATKEMLVVDDVRVELYQRVDAPTGQGFAISGDKAVSRAVSLSGGYATIDRNNAVLNGDRYLRGRRLFVESRVNFTPELSVSVFYSHAFHNDFPIPNNRRFDAMVSYNVLKALQRAGAI